jgi:hypothetical protein
MSFLQAYNAGVQAMRGGLASFGQTYDIRRLDGSTNVSIGLNAPVISGFQASIESRARKKYVENETLNLLAYEATCNNLSLMIGDLCSETGFGSDGGTYYVVEMRPPRPTIWIRAETVCSIARPNPEGGAATQLPESGNFAPPGYGGIPKSSDLVLTLVNGVFSFQESGDPASIQIGLQMRGRAKDGESLGTPSDVYRSEYVAYLPNLSNVVIAPLDRINTASGFRYEVKDSQSTGNIGIAGTICNVEILGTGE